MLCYMLSNPLCSEEIIKWTDDMKKEVNSSLYF